MGISAKNKSWEINVMYKRFGKRLLDAVISGVGILILAIPMLILVIAIKLDSPGPVLFRQKRVGIHKPILTF